jgi:RDD family
VVHPRALASITVGILGGMFCMVAVFAGIGALVFGSGFTFRPFGAALVNRRGQRISRVRAFIRALIAWSPIVAIAIMLKSGPDITDTTLVPLTAQIALLAALAAGAAWSIARPSRGLQDRIAGTWVVPR